MKSHVILLIALAALAAIILLSCTDDDCPVCPSTDDPVSDYNVYLATASMEYIYVFNTARGAITDSIFLGHVDSLIDIAVSANGSHLMYSAITGGTDQFVIVQLPTLDTITTLAGKYAIEVSPGGSYIALFGEDRLTFLDGRNYNVLFYDTLDLWQGRFLLNDSLFYAPIDTGRVLVYDPSIKDVDTIIDFSQKIGSHILLRAQPNATGSKIFFTVAAYTSWYGHRDYVLSYDLILDSISLISPLGYTSSSDIQMTPDGLQLIVNDPSDGNIDLWGSGKVIIIDANRDVIETTLPGSSPWQGTIPNGIYPGNWILTPDCRLAVFGGIEGGGSIGIVDLSTNQMVFTMPFSTSDNTPWVLACQKEVQ